MKRMRMRKVLSAAAAFVMALALCAVPEVKAETGFITEIYGSANGWNNNGAWVGFKLGSAIDLSDEAADIRVSYEYLEDGEIKSVCKTDGAAYEKNKYWEGYLNVGGTKYPTQENTALPADTLIETNLSASAVAGLDVTSKITSGAVTKVRAVVTVTNADGATETANSNWVEYTSDGTGSTPKGIGESSVSTVQAYVAENADALADATAFIGARQFVSLQAAIDAAAEGDTIELKDGTYEGPLTIDKAITIVGESKEGTVIAANDALNGNIITTNANVTLKNLTVDGKKFDLTAKHIQGHGIYATKGLTVDNVDVKNIGCRQQEPVCGCQTGIAIYVDGNGNDQDVSVTNVNLVDFQKAGIVCKTSGDVLIENAVITGEGKTDITAQNGIQINNSQNAVINNSEITGIEYDGNVTACGVLLVGGAQVSVNDCVFDGVQKEVSCYADNSGSAAVVKDGNIITKITEEGSEVTDVLCTGLSLDKTEITLKEGKTAELTATVAPENCTEEISWSVEGDDGNIITLKTDGMKATVTAKKAGTVKIVVRCGGYSAETTVKVEGAQTAKPGTSDDTTEKTQEISDKTSSDKAPKTGDTTDPTFWAILMLAGVSLACGVAVRKKTH